MATDLNASLLEEGQAVIFPETVTEQKFRHQQSDLMERLRHSAFPRLTYILGFLGVVLICLILGKIPKIDGGVPLLLNHEILISFAIVSVSGILLNLFIILIHILAFINARNLNKTESPSPKLLEKCFHNQKKHIRAIQVAESFLFAVGSSFWVYVLVVAVFGTFLPYRDASTVTGNSASLYQIATCVWISFKLLIDGFPKHWGLDSDL